MTVLIFANGEIEDGLEWVQPYLTQATAVIAADGGSRHLFKLQHVPDLVMGDLDSLPANVCTWLKAKNVPFMSFPAAKDETDLELALLHAVKHYPDDLLLFGTFGGRLDQTLANILLLTHPGLNGRHVELITAQERAWLIRAETEIRGQIGDTVSLIPLDGDVHIRTTSGLEWPLQDDVLVFGLARGVSNIMVAAKATVSVKSGSLLCIHHYQGKKERKK
jgi:thiamine pyrophosphokinase